MNYRKLIVESWQYTQKNKKLIRWCGFFPAIFTTTIAVWYIAYQFFAFKESYLFSADHESFFSEVMLMIWDFIIVHVSWTVPIILFVAIFFMCYLFVPTLTKATAIQFIARHKNGQNLTIGDSLKHAFFSFLRLFEYHLLIKTFGFFTILLEMSFVLRNLGPMMFKFLLPIFIIIMVVGFLLTLLFTYTDFFIVVDNKKVFESIKGSIKLVILNWKHTFLITILMILIGIRIIIQIFMVFLIPILIIMTTGYIATIVLPFTAVIIGAILGVICLIIAAYLNGIVDIFSYSVWTTTFLELTAQKEVSAREVFVDDLGEKPHDYHGHKNLEN